ncbi:MAG: DUF3850 domain-containing protein [Smithellaceae bacterium]|nr:DUF3850 domain-containing protein [Smithellaceae bacterium]
MGMTFHELKVDRKEFRPLFLGHKTFELRFNDRDYQLGDKLILKETLWSGEEMKAGKGPLEYTGWIVEAIVTNILRGPIWGLASGWVILSIQIESRTYLREEP